MHPLSCHHPQPHLRALQEKVGCSDPCPCAGPHISPEDFTEFTMEVSLLYAKDLMGCASGFSSPVYKFGRMILVLTFWFP